MNSINLVEFTQGDAGILPIVLMENLRPIDLTSAVNITVLLKQEDEIRAKFTTGTKPGFGVARVGGASYIVEVDLSEKTTNSLYPTSLFADVLVTQPPTAGQTKPTTTTYKFVVGLVRAGDSTTADTLL